MTAEIAILNRNAIALAADSAVTLQMPEGPKIYLTNKLFTLSKYEPVGVMLFGNADFMDVPWETVIKAYRDELGTRTFPTVEGYGQHFLRYIERNTSLFPISRQRTYLYEFARYWLRLLKIRFLRSAKQLVSQQKKVSTEELRQLFRAIVSEDLAHLRQHHVIPSLKRVVAKALLERHRSEIQQAIADELEQIVDIAPLARMERGCVTAVLRDLYWYGESGIVIAGFGANQIFPSLREYKLDRVINRRLRVLLTRQADIAPNMRAAVYAFAQSEMVSLFMDGADPEFIQFIGSSIHKLLADGFPSIVRQMLGKQMSAAKAAKTATKLATVGGNAVDTLFKEVANYQRERHWSPIIDVVASLPKEELAAMSEALVNLTSFKRHIAKQAETVGGPIDVAVISRGDGFIWIKRKHYFEGSLNPHFLTNYFKGTERTK